MALKVLDAGSCLMLSSESRRDIDGALAKYLGRGAKVLAPAEAVGSHWTAVCTPPLRSAEADITDRLKLSDLRQRASDRRGEPALDDGCRVTALGSKRIVTGPSKRQVLLRLEYLARLGYRHVGEIVQSDSKWVALADTGSRISASEPYRW